MANKIDAWQAEDGSLHDTECKAATRDVELIVAGSPLNDNSPYAKKLVLWLTTEAPMIRKMLEAHERACPRDAEAVAPAEERDEDGHKKFCGFHTGFECDCGAPSDDTAEDLRGEMIHHGR